MTAFTLNYLIIACVFNFFYYWFNGRHHIQQYIYKTIDVMLRELEKRDPLNPLSNDLRAQMSEIFNNSLANEPFFRLFGDLLFFPVNLILIFVIIVDMVRKY